MTPDIVKSADQFFTIMYDGNASERMYVIRAPSKEVAIERFHRLIDPEFREEYSSDEEFQSSLPGLHKVREQRFTITPCTFNPDGIALIWER
jgi:hypothetical protein